MLVDAHCHLQSEEFDQDRDEVITRCHERRMTCIVVGNQYDDSQKAVALAEQHEGIYAAVGLHPIYANDESWDEDAFTKLLEHSRVVAVGEVGLDYYRLWADTPEEELAVKRTQKELLKKQIDFARRVQKPLILHCRDAYGDLLRIVRHATDVPMMIHTYLGSAEEAQKFLDIGIPLSFSGIVTFEDEDPVLQAVKAVPLDMMMIETDAPQLAPAPYRGKRNEPIYVEEVAKKIAELKGVSIEEVVEQTGENARRFFRLP
jgi:TatD DNase family protein